MYTQISITASRPAVDMASPVVFVEPALVELLCRNMPYDELVGYYDFTDEEINAASYYISHTAPDDILAMLEELAYMKEEEEGWTW